jgi:hypothetical protein
MTRVIDSVRLKDGLKVTLEADKNNEDILNLLYSHSECRPSELRCTHSGCTGTLDTIITCALVFLVMPMLIGFTVIHFQRTDEICELLEQLFRVSEIKLRLSDPESYSSLVILIAAWAGPFPKKIC